MPAKEWTIEIDRHRGFAPRYFEGSYPSYGNKSGQSQAGAMQNMSLLDPSVLKPGPGTAELTNGDQGGVVTTLIKGIIRHAISSDVAYGIGGAKLYKFSASTVNSGGSPSWPRTIDKSVVTAESGEDVAYYQGSLYYSYGHSGSAGDMGKYDLSTTFDDDYYSASATGGADLQDGPHQLLVGGDDILYIANGRFIASLDGSTASPQALDFWQNSIVNSITWNYNRVIAAVNRPNITGANQNQSAIYRWNGYSSSWEGDPVEISGRIGALYTKNGITYVWHENFEGGTARLVFGYINGGSVVPLRTFSGSLPLYYQVGEYFDYIAWLSSGRLYLYGPVSGEMPVDMFQFMSPQYTANAGGIASPFGTMLISSNDGSNYSLEKESGYAVSATYKTLLHETSLDGLHSYVGKIEFQFDQLASGARVDVSLVDNKGTTIWSETISHTAHGTATKAVFYPAAQGENMRLQYDHASGSASNPVNIRKVKINGKNIPLG